MQSTCCPAVLFSLRFWILLANICLLNAFKSSLSISSRLQPNSWRDNFLMMETTAIDTFWPSVPTDGRTSPLTNDRRTMSHVVASKLNRKHGHCPKYQLALVTYVWRSLTKYSGINPFLGCITVSQKYVFFRENNINRAAVALQNGHYKFSEWQNHRMTKSRYHKNVKLHKFEIMST